MVFRRNVCSNVRYFGKYLARNLSHRHRCYDVHTEFTQFTQTTKHAHTIHSSSIHTSTMPNAPSGKLRPLNEQVVVITGASSGIGRLAAKRFAEAGYVSQLVGRAYKRKHAHTYTRRSKVVAVARSEPGLISLTNEIKSAGGTSIYAICDVSDYNQVKGVAETTVKV